MHIKVDGNLSVYAANEIVEEIEKLIKKHMPVLRGLTIISRTDKKIKIK